MMDADRPTSRLMLVTDRHATAERPLAEVVGRAVLGGVGMVQVREPDLDDDEVLQLVASLRRAIPGEVCLVLNDRPALAASLGLGLHLPYRSVEVADAAADCEIVANPLGVSVHSEAELEVALRRAPSYVVLGTAYETSCKAGRPGIGAEAIGRLANKTRLPCYAIGGVTPETTRELLRAGCYGVAVRSAILGAEDPTAASRAFVSALA